MANYIVQKNGSNFASFDNSNDANRMASDMQTRRPDSKWTVKVEGNTMATKKKSIKKSKSKFAELNKKIEVARKKAAKDLAAARKKAAKEKKEAAKKAAKAKKDAARKAAKAKSSIMARLKRAIKRAK